MRGPSKLEKKFALLWRAANGPKLVTEFKFCPTRRWRADFASIEKKVLIEIEGGIFGGGRHNRGLGFSKDCEKYLWAETNNWHVLRLTYPQLTLETIEQIVRFVNSLEVVKP